MDAQGFAEANGSELAVPNEEVDEGTADVEDVSYFTEVEQTGLHAFVQCIPQARVGGKGEAETTAG